MTETIDYTKQLRGKLADNPFWITFAEQLTTLFSQEIDGPRKLLSTIREMIGTEDWYQILNFKQLGFSLDPNIFTDPQHSSIYKYWSTYNLSRGASGEFINFFGFLLNAFFTIEQLWTQDYLTFVYSSGVTPGTEIWNGGNWYPTTKIDLTYNNAAFDQAAGVISENFYKIAPIHLVLRNISGVTATTTNEYIVPVLGPYDVSNEFFPTYIQTAVVYWGFFARAAATATPKLKGKQLKLFAIVRASATTTITAQNESP